MYDWSLSELIILMNAIEGVKFEGHTCRATLNRREIDEHEIPSSGVVYLFLKLEQLV